MYGYREYLKPPQLFLAWGRCALIGAYYRHCYNTGWGWKKQVQENRSLHYLLMTGRKYKGALRCERGELRPASNLSPAAVGPWASGLLSVMLR